MPNKNCGFTLIEALIYLALFGILIAGVGAAAYVVVEAGGRDAAGITVQEEAGFLLGKINWALTGASSLQIPANGVLAPSLLMREYAGPSPLVFDLNGNKFRLKEGGLGMPADLNSDAVQVVKLVFTDIPPASGKPEGVIVSFTLRSAALRGAITEQDFSITKYLR